MVDAFILVKTAAGSSEGLLSAVRALEPVASAHIVAGDYDLVVEATGPDVYDVLQVASSDIQQLDGVMDTKTYIALG